MCEAMKNIRSDAKESGIAEGVANYKRKLRELYAKMKEADRQGEFFDTIEDDAKLDGFFKEFDVK